MSGGFSQCPICGWTGSQTELEGDGDIRACPSCDGSMRVD